PPATPVPRRPARGPQAPSGPRLRHRRALRCECRRVRPARRALRATEQFARGENQTPHQGPPAARDVATSGATSAIGLELVRRTNATGARAAPRWMGRTFSLPTRTRLLHQAIPAHVRRTQGSHLPACARADDRAVAADLRATVASSAAPLPL